MSGKRRKNAREKDMTRRFANGDFDEDRVEQQQRFSERSKGAEQSKILRTAMLRVDEQTDIQDLERLPVGQVTQVYSLFSEVEHEGQTHLCVIRKTLARVSELRLVVGDYVRFRDGGAVDEQGRPEAVIEQILPRRTVLARADSFTAMDIQPIVANADQVLIVASLRQPTVKWGLIDRMLVAAQGGGLRPIICLNKIDLASSKPSGPAEMAFAQEALAHYETLGITTLQTSVEQAVGLEALRAVLAGRTTALAGHSGVGKSSLIGAIEPLLDIRIGAISHYTDKGRHTTSSARHYALSFGGHIVDTPGVKLFGLWGVTRENLESFFPDMLAENAPEWRQDSYRRILETLPA
jgi:ribosome biogenesis GTPase